MILYFSAIPLAIFNLSAADVNAAAETPTGILEGISEFDEMLVSATSALLLKDRLLLNKSSICSSN
jgi:hypothetical protein